jgi:hypothetical protein
VNGTFARWDRNDDYVFNPEADNEGFEADDSDGSCSVSEDGGYLEDPFYVGECDWKVDRDEALAIFEGTRNRQ